MKRSQRKYIIYQNHLQLIIASLAIIILHLNFVVNTDNFTADVAQQTTKACVAFSCSVFWLAHAVISNKCMLILLIMPLYIHVESPKGMQFASKYEICELKRL